MKAFWQSRGEAIEVLQLGDCGGLNTCLYKAYTIFFLGPQCSHGDVTCALFVSPHFCTHYLLSSTSQLHSIKSVTQILLKKKKKRKTPEWLRLILKQVAKWTHYYIHVSFKFCYNFNYLIDRPWPLYYLY